MRFAFVSTDGTGLAFWLRVKAEGHDVKVYIPDNEGSFVHRNNGKGLVNLATSVNEIVAWGSGQPCVYVFDCSGIGELADKLRRMGRLVVGGGSFCDRLEQDRLFGEKIVQSVGCLVPKTHSFSSISETIAFLKGPGSDGDWYFKSDAYLSISTTAHGHADKLIRRLESYKARYRDSVKNMLQETIEGTDISTAAYWNGSDWVWPYEGTVENKKLMAGDVGPATGCAMNVVWFYDEEPQIARALRFAAVAEVFRKLNAPPCIYDMNAIISKENRLPYFLEWTPRYGYDADPTASRGLTGELGKFYYDLASGRAALAPFETDTAQMSVRLSVAPYPWEQTHKLPSDIRGRATGSVGVPIGGVNPSTPSELYGGEGNSFIGYGIGVDDRGELVVMDPEGLLGIACAEGTSVERMNDEILGFIEDDLDVPDVQYRNDAGETLSKHLDCVRALGHSTGCL